MGELVFNLLKFDHKLSFGSGSKGKRAIAKVKSYVYIIVRKFEEVLMYLKMES